MPTRQRARTLRTRRADIAVEALEARALLATITVTSLADGLQADGQVTLREAIQAANEDVSVDGSTPGDGLDTIVFQPDLHGTVVLTQGALIIDDALTIDASGRSRIGITSSSFERDVLNVWSDGQSGPEVRLRNLHISGGRMGIYVGPFMASTLIVDNCLVTENKRGIYALSHLRVVDSELSSNGNKRNDGGAILALGNSQRRNPERRIDVSIVRAVIRANKSGINGGTAGVSVNAARVTISRSLFRGNTVVQDVPTAFRAANSEVLIRNSTLSSNGPGRSVIDLFSQSGLPASLKIEHSTIAENASSGVSAHTDLASTVPGVVEIVSSIIARNGPGNAADLSFPANQQSRFQHSLVGSNATTNLLPTKGSPDVNGNLVGSPENRLNPLLLPMADNGGPTMTHLPAAGSPVIDAGPTTFTARTDQRGGRFVRATGSAVDMGAVEVGGSPFTASMSRTTVNEDDADRTVTLDVTLTRNLPGPIDVDAATLDDTAQATQDFLPSSETLSFDGTAGQTRRFTVRVLDDAEYEQDEFFLVRLTSASSGGAPLPLVAVRISSDETTGVGMWESELRIRGGAAADVATVSSSAGDLRVDFNGVQTAFNADAVTNIHVDLRDGNNRFESPPGLSLRTIVLAGAGDDTISTGAGDDSVFTRAGDDVITTNDGRDSVSAGGGNDSVRTGDRADVVDAGKGSDHVIGGAGADFLFGRRGRDVLDGGQGPDTLVGGSGGDVLIGRDGDDWLEGHTNPEIDAHAESETRDGSDTLHGDRGNDLLDGRYGNNRLFGGLGDDDLRGVGIHDGGPGNDDIRGTGVLRGGDGNDLILTRTGKTPSRLIGGPGADTLAGGQHNDTLLGGDGDDRLRGKGGADSIEGGPGNDLLLGHDGRRPDGNDTLAGNAGKDTLDGDLGDDSLLGGAGRDLLRGLAGDDFLAGHQGRDRLEGGDDSDVLLGGQGPDRLIALSGRDIAVGGAGRDYIEGRAGADILISGTTTLSDQQFADVLNEWTSARTFATRTDNLRDGSGSVDRLNGNAFLVFASGVTQTVFDDGEVDTVRGGAGIDWFFVAIGQDDVDDDGDLFE